MRSRDLIYYDGACGMCRRSSLWLLRLDWLSRLERRDMLRVSEEELPVKLDAALEGMPMRTRNGRVLVGFQAVRRALLQTPVGFLPAALLYLPVLSHAGARVYAQVAKSRRRDRCKVQNPQ